MLTEFVKTHNMNPFSSVKQIYPKYLIKDIVTDILPNYQIMVVIIYYLGEDFHDILEGKDPEYCKLVFDSLRNFKGCSPIYVRDIERVLERKLELALEHQRSLS